jgi:hypothetical protein
MSAGVSDLTLVDEMLEIARKHAHRPDGRIGWIAEWVRANLAPGDRWNERRLVLFTEYEDTRRWAEKRLAEALDDLQADDRIASFTGATPLTRREAQRRFNSDPAQDPLRILLCTDAAREGINLQRRCHNLVHMTLPLLRAIAARRSWSNSTPSWWTVCRNCWSHPITRCAWLIRSCRLAHRG